MFCTAEFGWPPDVTARQRLRDLEQLAADTNPIRKHQWK